MLYAEFLAKVRVRGEYTSQKEGEHVSRAVVALLGTQLDQGNVRDVAHSVPEQVAETLRASSVGGHQLGTDEFLATVANTRRSETLESARWDVSTVLSTLAEALATDAPNQTLTELSPGFASLLGHPETRPHSCHARCAYVCRPPSPRPPHRSSFPSSLDVR